MINQSTPSLRIQSIDCPPGVYEYLRRSRFRQACSDAGIVFLLFGFLGFSIAGIARTFFFSDLSSGYSAVCGFGCGLIAALVMIFMDLHDLPAVLSEVVAGSIVEASVDCQRAIKVRFDGSDIEGVALDCGEEVLVLRGNWWANENKREIWDDLSSRQRFPAQKFCIRYLPKSGQVIQVDVIEGPLRVDEPETELVISLHCHRYAEVIHLSEAFYAVTAQ